jgi:hypothetical protein
LIDGERFGHHVGGGDAARPAEAGVTGGHDDDGDAHQLEVALLRTEEVPSQTRPREWLGLAPPWWRPTPAARVAADPQAW